jgi:hypothetical protein
MNKLAAALAALAVGLAAEGAAALNPQPLPPRIGYVFLNPQPLPPRIIRVGLNPQPLPPNPCRCILPKLRVR